jgi:hypothetical protein
VVLFTEDLPPVAAPAPVAPPAEPERVVLFTDDLPAATNRPQFELRRTLVEDLRGGTGRPEAKPEAPAPTPAHTADQGAGKVFTRMPASGAPAERGGRPTFDLARTVVEASDGTPVGAANISGLRLHVTEAPVPAAAARAAAVG